LKRLYLLAILLFTTCAVLAHADPDVTPAQRKKITEIMDVMGVKNITRQVSLNVAKQLAFGLQQAQPDIDPKAFDVVLSVSDEVLAARSGELLEKMVPIYAKHFTEAELDELLAFYRSPVGRKTTETMPAVMRESMEMAVNESESSVPKIKERVTEKLRADGLIKDK
jgi:uncharacterized protein